MFARVRRTGAFLSAFGVIVMPVLAAEPKLDKETCSQFRSEQIKFIQSGILADLQRGPDWGKANLSSDRLREIELYITLDEQIKFACREATLTPDLAKVEEIAKRLELNPNLDPFAPVPPPEAVAVPGSGSDGAPISKKQIDPEAPAKPKPAAQGKPKPKPAAKAQKQVNDAYTGPPIAGSDPMLSNGPSGSE